MDDLSGRLDAIAAACPGVAWGMALRSAGTGELLAAHRPDAVLPTASVGKLLLLAETARLLDAGDLDQQEPLHRHSVEPVADSGLWQHLAVDVLPVHDLCVLIGAVSDNLATNVLLERVGLARLAALAGELGLRRTRLHDRVRDVRGATDAGTLSSGTAGELSGLFASVHTGGLVSPAVSARVREWLGTGTDLSMAVSAYHLDPLAHAAGDRGVHLVHKTGTDAGVRADTGLVVAADAAVAYAVIAGWPPAEDRRDDVHRALRRVGEVLRELVPPAA